MALLADDLLLLMLPISTGDLKDHRITTEMADLLLGGAVLTELVLCNAVTVDDRTTLLDWLKPRKVRAADAPEPADPTLRRVLTTVQEKASTPRNLVTTWATGSTQAFASRLVDTGHVRHGRHEGWLLWRDVWPAADLADRTYRDDLIESVAAVLLSDAEPDDRTGPLVSLLSISGQVHRVISPHGSNRRERRAIQRRAKEIASCDWASEPARNAILAVLRATDAAGGGDGGDGGGGDGGGD